VLELFAMALGMPRHYFAPMVDRPFSYLRFVNYPALVEPALEGQLRAGAHSDYGTFTFVHFDDAPGGLQVLGDDGSWIDVPVVPNAFVVNVGDLFQQWTNDRWRSTLHRVVTPEPPDWDRSARLSLVYFHEPNWDAVAEPLPSCVDADPPAKYGPVTAGEHLALKVSRQVDLG
jgi:isopenicillin N synthase-like dioxygenase